jgi:hypothetical protein
MVERDIVFVGDEEKKKKVQKKRTYTKKKRGPGPEYLKISLSSLGRLNAPSPIHIRNYTGEDALSLSLATEDNIEQVLVSVLNNAIYESIDCSYLHPDELEEIMLNIYVNYWSSVVSYPYPYEEEELEEMENQDRAEAIKKGKETPLVDLRIDQLKTKSISDKFKEPFTVNIKGEEAKFILPRIGHIIEAQKYIEKKFLKEDNDFADLKKAISVDKDVVPIKDQKAFDTYQRNRAAEYIIAQYGQRLVSYGSKTLNTVNEKAKYYKKVGLHFWKAYNDIVEQYADFGIIHDIEVVSPLTGKPVTRRFQFRWMDFLPSVDEESVSEYDVSFGA